MHVWHRQWRSDNNKQNPYFLAAIIIRFSSRIGFDLHKNRTVERHSRHLKFRCPVNQETIGAIWEPRSNHGALDIEEAFILTQISDKDGHNEEGTKKAEIEQIKSTSDFYAVTVH